MKVEKIQVIHLGIPLPHPYKLSHHYKELNESNIVIVKVFTDEGIIGIGETDPWPPFTDETPETVMEVINHYLGPVLLGMNPLEINAIIKVMDGILKGNYLAKAALDMACYDIAGKALGIPVCNLLGGKVTDKIPIMNALGTGEPEKNALEALEMKNMGYHSLMIKVGTLDIREDAKRVMSIRETVGKDYPLIVDANQAWNVVKAIEFARLIEDYNVQLLEQPVPYWDISGLKKVRDAVSIPISADESLFTLYDAINLIQQDVVDVFSIKVCKHGGIFKTKQIMNLAEAYGIPCLMNSLIEEGITQGASLQLGVSASNLYEYGHAYFSPLRLAEDITDYSEQLVDGWVKFNGKPGLGVVIKEDVIAKYKKSQLVIRK